jgi:hypothetical protein
MRYLSSITSRTGRVMIVFIMAALAVTPRSGAAINVGSPPHRLSLICPTGSFFCYQTVIEKSSDNNYVTGINDFQEIVGAYGNPTNFKSFVGTNNDNTSSQYTLITSGETYSGTSGSSWPTYLAALTIGQKNDISSLYQVGYVTPPGEGSEGAILFPHATSGNGVWSFIQDPNQAKSGGCAVTQVLAVSDSRIGVGFYDTNPTTTGSPCVQHAFEFYSTKAFTGPYTYADLTPGDPSGDTQDVTSSVASGINILGDVVGTVTWKSSTSSGTGGWIYADLQYSTFCYNGNAKPSCSGGYPTHANGINFSDVVVGNYTESGDQNGFAITSPDNDTNKFSIIDIPNTTDTVLNSITEATNTTESVHFAGWARPEGSNPKYEGIVGTCTYGHCAESGNFQRSPHHPNAGRREKGRP